MDLPVRGFGFVTRFLMEITGVAISIGIIPHFRCYRQRRRRYVTMTVGKTLLNNITHAII